MLIPRIQMYQIWIVIEVVCDISVHPNAVVEVIHMAKLEYSSHHAHQMPRNYAILFK